MCLTSWRARRLVDLEVDATTWHRHQTRRIAFFGGTALGVIITVLGGGSDALHQMVLVFTNFMASAATRVKGEGIDKREGEQGR